MTVARPSPWLLAPVLTALLLFALAYRDVVFAALCALAVLGAYGHRLTTRWPEPPRWRAAAGTALLAWALCAVYYWTVLHGGTHLTYFRRTLDVYKPWMITTSGMLLALAVVWGWHLSGDTSRRTRVILIGLGLLVVTTGNILSLPPLYLPVLGLFFATTMIALIAGADGFQGHRGYPWKERLGRGAVIVGGLAAIGVGTWILSDALRLLEAGIITVQAEFMQGAQYDDVIGTGGNITIARHRRVVLLRKIVATVEGQAPSGYLRTQVMTDYQAGRWKTDRMATEPVASLVAPQDGHRRRFDLPQRHSRVPQEATQPTRAVEGDTSTAGPSPPFRQRTFSLLINLRGAVPLPYDAQRVTTIAAASCSMTEGRVLHCNAPEGLRYDVDSHPAAAPVPYGTGAALMAEAGSEVQRARQAPESVLAPLRVLAQLLVGDHATHPLEAAQVLQHYFRSNYIYALTVDLAEQGDPIVDFVLNRRPAYCEYYASGLALMLRSLGIPARVIGGFVVREYNPLAGQWIVRQSNAHAWTEVFDTQSGQWVAFDATPPTVVALLPTGGVRVLGMQGWSWIELQCKTFATWLRVADLHAWLAHAGQAGMQVCRHPASLVALVLGVVLLVGRRQRRRIVAMLTALWPSTLVRRRSAGASLDSTTVATRQLFEHVAHALEAQGLPIGPAETLEEYLRRAGHHLTLPSNGPGVLPAAVPEEADALWLQKLTEFARAYTDVRFRPRPREVDTTSATVTQAQLTALRALAVQVVATLGRRQPR